MNPVSNSFGSAKNKSTKDNFWDNYAVKYDPFMTRLKPTYDLLIRKIITHLNKTDDVLEVATGTGEIALSIASHVNHVWGCDLSGEMINVANQKLSDRGLGNIEFSIQDICSLDFPAAKYNLVIAANILHLLENPAMALESIKKVLKPDGLLITPTFCHGQGIKSRIISAIMSLSGFKAHQKWSVESFKSFMLDNDFKIVELEVIPEKIPLTFVVAAKKD